MNRIYHAISRLALISLFLISAGSALAQQKQSKEKKKQAEIHLPEPTGPYSVGFSVFHWVDKSRPEIGTDDQADVRELMVDVYYPADVQFGSKPAPYVPRANIYRQKKVFDDKDMALVTATHRFAALDAAPKNNSQVFPLAVLSTGNGEMSFMYTSLAEELASHGFVIAILSHPGVADMIYPDGRVLKRYARLYNPKPEGWDKELSKESTLSLRRAIHDSYYLEASKYLSADVSFVIDRLLENDGKSEAKHLKGMVDPDKIITIGHSYGGNVAIEACARDHRVKACVAMDGSAFLPIRDEGLSKPYMLFRPAFLSDGSSLRVSQTQLFGSIKADAYEINILGAEHRSFMDSRFLFPENRLTPTGPARALAITSLYIQAFADRYLFDKKNDLLDGRSRRFPDVFPRILRFDYPPKDYEKMREASLREVREH